MKIKTEELIGTALDWAVAKCEGHLDDWCGWLYEATLEEVEEGSYHPSTKWSQGGEIIEREQVENRPLQNIHRRSLDDVWRQVIRRMGADDVSLIGPAHDELLKETK